MHAVEFTTDCGAKLFFIATSRVRSLAMGVLVKAGSRDEILPQESGLAHAFEHMVFRGNAKFATSDALTGYLEKVGGKVDANTDKETTFYHAVMPAEYAERGVEHLYHLVSTPIFHSRYIPPEIQNLIGEIKERNDDPEELVDDLSDEIMYGIHPLGKPILGTIESLNNLTRENFQHWQERFYHPSNFTFVVVGNAKAKEILALFNKYFKYTTAKPRNNRAFISNCTPKQRHFALNKDVEQLHVSLVAPIGGADRISTNALNLFEYMIDGGMSFPIFQELRERHGLGYRVGAEMRSESDIGVFKISMGIDPEKLDLALKAIFKIIRTSASDQQLFDEAKGLLLGRMAIEYEGTPAVLEKIVDDIVLEGRPKLIEETLKEIKEIKLEEVVKAVEKYLRQENFVQVFIAPNGVSM